MAKKNPPKPQRPVLKFDTLKGSHRLTAESTVDECLAVIETLLDERRNSFNRSRMQLRTQIRRAFHAEQALAVARRMVQAALQYESSDVQKPDFEVPF